MKKISIKSLKRVPWLINYELHGGKIIYLISACKGFELYKCWESKGG